MNNYLYHTTTAKKAKLIERQGLKSQYPDEWKGLIPKRDREKKVVWLLGRKTTKANIRVIREQLDENKLHKIDRKDVNWYYYTGSIDSRAIESI